MQYASLERAVLSLVLLGSAACTHAQPREILFPRPTPAPRFAQLSAEGERGQADVNPVADNAKAPTPSAPNFSRFVAGAEARRCPIEMARVGRVCVDKYESVLVQMLPRGKEQAWSVHRPPDASKLPLRAVAKAGVKPQAFVSGVEAQKACFAAGKRLCGAGEWRRACRGPRSLNYPYGEKRKRGVCNDSGRKTHPVAAVASRYGIPRERMWSEGMQHPKINRLPNTVRATAASKGCTNAFGVYDMVGNLHEWVDDPAGTFQGGYYMDTKINGDGCNYRTTAHGFSYRDYSTGFRCCMDADNVE